MDWVLRIAALLFVAFVAFLLLLEVIHTVAQRVRDWRDVRDGREWFVCSLEIDERRVVEQIKPRTGRVKRVERHR